MSDDRQQLLGDITLGIEVEAFLTSDIGKYLVRRAEEELLNATELLTKVDPENPKEIRELQTRIWRANSVQQWMAEAIQSGWNAENTLQQMDATD